MQARPVHIVLHTSPYTSILRVHAGQASAQRVACIAGTYLQGSTPITCNALRFALQYGGMRAFPGQTCAPASSSPPVAMPRPPNVASLVRMCWQAPDDSTYAALVSQYSRALSHPYFALQMQRVYGAATAVAYAYYASWPLPPPIYLRVRVWLRVYLQQGNTQLSPPPPCFNCQGESPPPSPPPPAPPLPDPGEYLLMGTLAARNMEYGIRLLALAASQV